MVKTESDWILLDIEWVILKLARWQLLPISLFDFAVEAEEGQPWFRIMCYSVGLGAVVPFLGLWEKNCNLAEVPIPCSPMGEWMQAPGTCF